MYTFHTLNKWHHQPGPTEEIWILLAKMFDYKIIAKLLPNVIYYLGEFVSK